MSDSVSRDLASLKIDRNATPRSSRWGRSIVLALVLLLGVGGGGFWGYQQLEGYIFKTTVQTTTIHQISPAQASVVLTATGYVVPQIRSKVSAKVLAKIKQVHVKEGQMVKAGDVLMELDDSHQRAELATARSRVFSERAKVATARANLAETSQQIQRQRRLVELGAAARSGLEDLEARAESLRAAVLAAQAAAQAAESEVERLEVLLEQATILAPIDGTVVTEPAHAGETADPAGAPVLEVADLESLVVETDVPEARLHLVRLGGPSEIVLDAFPDRRLRGATHELGQRVDRAKATAIVRVRFVDRPEGVLPDMSARVSFLSEALPEDALKAKDKTVVPESAISERNGRSVVFVVERGKVRAVTVELGEKVASGFELMKGPSPGTQVVSEAPATLKDGQPVRADTD